MRTLKRILALVLALVMSLSLVTIANAADFTDSDEIDYEEAVEVMSAIGVINGMDDGSYDPDGILTREQAAKLITYMLLGSNAEKLGVESSRFNDVAVTRWSAPSIEYCATLGIIDGAGDGNFYPAAKLTGYAFAKMLLTALGYDSKIEGFTGTSWAINVATIAMEVGLDAGLENGISSAELTRQEAAQMALNAIKTPLVTYDKQGTITVNGSEVSFGSTEAKYVTTTLAKEQRISDQKLSNSDNYTVEFGEKYFPTLRLNRGADEFERPSHTWVYNGAEIGSYTDYDLQVASYTEAVSGRDLYDLLGKSTIDNYSMAYYVDGAVNTTIKASNMIRTNTRDYATTGKGVLTQVFVNHDKDEITITSVNTYLAQADADYNETRGTLSLTVYQNDANGVGKTVDVEDIAHITDYKEGDFMLVNMAAIGSTGDKMEVVRVNDVETMEDCTVTGYSKASSVTVDGTDYDYAKKSFYKDGVLDEYNQGYLADYTYTFYLDQYGYVIGADIYEGEANYLFMTGYDLNGSNLAVSTATAGAIFLDGEMTEIKVNVKDTNENIEDYNDEVASNREYDILADVGGNKGDSEYNCWFRYTTTEKNGSTVYTLTPAENWVNELATSAGGEVNSANIRVGTGSNRAYGNDASVYITVDTGAVDLTTATGITKVNGVHTGVQEVDLKLASTSENDLTTPKASIFALYDEDHYIIGAIIVGEDINNTKNYAYILDTDAQREYRENGKNYWDVEAVVDGEIVTLTIEDYANTISNIQSEINDERGAMYRVTYNADGNVIEAELCKDTEAGNVNGDYVYGNLDYTNRDIDPDYDKIYNVANIDDEALSLMGRALYIGNSDDYGLFLASGAPIIVVQYEVDENGRNEKLTYDVYSSASSALNALKDKDHFSGSISAVLNASGTATYLVLNSDDAIGITTDDGTSNSGKDGLLTYSATNFNGYAVVNIKVSTPEYAAAGANVDYVVNILADGEIIDTLNNSGSSFNANNGSQTERWTGIVFDSKAEITAELVAVEVDNVAVKYVDGETKDTLYLNSWKQGATVETNTGKLTVTDASVGVTSGNDIQFTVVTDDTNKTLQYTLSGLADGNVTTATTVSANNNAQQTLNGSAEKAAGDDFVVVTIYGLSKLQEQYEITEAGSMAADDKAAFDVAGGSAAAKKVSELQTNLSSYSTDTVKVEVSKMTGIGLNEKVRFTLTVATGDNAYAYNVTIKTDAGDIEFKNVTDTVNSGVYTKDVVVTSDIEVSDIEISVATNLLAIDKTATATKISDDGKTLTITFNEDVEAVFGTLSADDFSVTTGTSKAFIDSIKVSGNVVTLTFSTALKNSETVQITAANICGGGYTGNTLTGDATITINESTGTYSPVSFS